ncbi:hypothetical protein BEWA_004230 [Theileria equi strain WA]|uniref:XPG N-terminal domain-containing protein n=1 Tax=Theileria equi strain WA TaxID=1537102 RepID=L0AZM3_THEEQ|nr:hypothetical protein BEWA_004230 [Theileria equi strain WA]AFZ81015.1 hypothetical protein BEWA_004230 [Theileria equi strain WA]|eukprot:XP_004830681.1 hypothetical protein BEWA_004230 [Theileria equi strain WA]
MRVRHLQAYLREQKCVKVGNLSVCRGMRIGIDAIYFFKSLKALNDPLSDAFASLPPSFLSTVDEQLQLMDSLEIQPLFVFQGMQPKSHMLLSAQMIGFAMHDGWLSYVRGEEALAKSKFSQNIYKEFSEEIVQFLMAYLKSKGREVIRAPYFASSQLIYFVQESLVDAVVGPPSSILFGLPRVIIGMDLVKSVFEWIELEEILQLWGVDRDQLVDACLLAGTEHCLSYPLFAQPFSFANAIEYIKQAPLIKYLYQIPARERLNEYVDGYCIGKSLVTYPLVLTLNGDVTSLTKRDLLPSDYHKIVGCRLPKSVYYLVSEGLVSIQLPFSLALGEWIDESNQNADSVEYSELLSDLREYHCRAVGLLVLKLDEHFKTKQIRFSKHVSLSKNSFSARQPANILIPNTCAVKHWNINAANLAKELKRQGADGVSLEFCLRWHGNVGSQLLSQDVDADSKDGADFNVMNAILHFMLLDNLGFFTNECGATAFGCALASSELGMDGLLALELMKFGLFTGETFESPPEGPYSPDVQYNYKREENRRFHITVNLISRLATLSSVQLDNNLWKGKIDYDIASFNVVIKLLKRSINYLTEGCLAYLLLSDTNRLVKIENGAFDPTNPQVPLFYDKFAFMGVVLKFIFMGPSAEFLNEDAVVNVETVGATSLEQVQETFPNCTNIAQDLDAFIDFWVKLHKLVHDLANLIQLGDILGQFDHGTLLLASKLAKLGINTEKLKL